MEKPAPPELVLEAGRASRNYWRDLWRYRDLLAFLTWRDLVVRYKQTAVGVAWALLQPLLTMAVFVVFGGLLGVPTGGVPRPVMVFAALLPWQFFSAALSACSGSLVNSSNLISKVYFPRLIVPLSAILVSLVDFFVSAVFLALLMLWYGLVPDWRIVALPLFTFLAFACALGGGLWLTALMVRYRDFRIVLPFVLQFGTYVSPVAFNSSLVPQKWFLFYSLNPMVSVIDGFRWCLLGGGQALNPAGLALSAAFAAVLLWSGLAYFRKTERSFADVI
ncbi:ABC transporter permease [Opitutus sp. GAS368]|jgi:lipopolysaccharide transport system permease protein|uniref:ABC transporter permease n=1 Tax=Opitutus sp. GAS368 TaxID=1882749 RepID=UPI00087DC4AE|nr:ABC transporter permease [Opitutus sp. GAS368]SDS63677.1 lipopolysaccharide transport system permease protein [Opitutus sp. GAS368]